MNRTRLAIFSAFVSAILLLPGCSGWQRGKAESLTLYGNIELTQVNLAFKIAGKLSFLEIHEGDRVSRGAILARIDTAQLQNQRNREAMALAAAESLIPQLRTSIERQRISVSAETDMRRAQLAQAEARLRELLSGSRAQEIEQARALVEQARPQHQQALRDWERAQVLYKNDDISTAQFDQFRSRFDTTAAALRQAQEQLALIVEGPRKEQIEAARSQVDQARAGLQMIEVARLEWKRLEQELQTRGAQVDQARAQVAVMDAQLADAVAVSPADGVVLVKSAEVGEILAPGTVFATIGVMDRPWLRAYVGEQDLGRVKLGAKVKVGTDSFPGKIYWGRISFISSEAEFTPKQIQTPEERVKLVYRIKIEVENPQYELKLNMPAEAEILLSEKTEGR